MARRNKAREGIKDIREFIRKKEVRGRTAHLFEVRFRVPRGPIGPIREIICLPSLTHRTGEARIFPVSVRKLLKYSLFSSTVAWSVAFSLEALLLASCLAFFLVGETLPDFLFDIERLETVLIARGFLAFWFFR